MSALRDNSPDIVREVRDLLAALRSDPDGLPRWAGEYLDGLEQRPDLLGFTQQEVATLRRLHVGGDE